MCYCVFALVCAKIMENQTQQDNQKQQVSDVVIDREIIGLVQANGVLWDRRIKTEKLDKATVDQLWEQIGAALSVPRSGVEVHTRWKSMRDQFSRELRKERKDLRSTGAGCNGITPKWVLFEDLSFLKDIIKPRRKPAAEELKCKEERMSSCSDSDQGRTNKTCVGIEKWTATLIPSESGESDEEMPPDDEAYRSKIRNVVPHKDFNYKKKRKVQEENDINMAKTFNECLTKVCYVVEKLGSLVEVPSDSKPLVKRTVAMWEECLKNVPQEKLMHCIGDVTALIIKFSAVE